MSLQQDYLNAIARTRLLFSKNEDLFKALGYSKDTKTLGNIGGSNEFIKQAVLSALDEIYAKSISQDLDLTDLLDDYAIASGVYAKIRRHKYFKDKKCHFRELIEFLVSTRDDVDDAQLMADIKTIAKETKDDNGYAIPIMLLILWELIPSYNNRKESCDVADIRSDFNEMLEHIETAVKESSIMKRLVIIDRVRTEMENNPDNLNRLWLIFALASILTAYYNISDPTNLAEAVRTLEPMELDINGYWEDVKSADDPDPDRACTLWHFESSNNVSYVAKQILRDHGSRFYRRYEFDLVYNNGNVVAMFVPTEGETEAVMNGYISDSNQVLALVNVSKDDKSDDMLMYIDCCNESNPWFQDRTMRKIKDDSKVKEMFARLNSISKSEDWEVVDSAFALTDEYIYFRVPGTEKFYKVPRTESFMEASLYELVMIRNERQIAVGCPMSMSYFLVTTEQDLHKNGILIVESILE